MTKEVVVSIITATWNLLKNSREKSIIKCVESVHNQKDCRIEHIIIDGGSTDGTLELLRPYEEKGWVKIYFEPDQGIYDAFNKGIQKAQGKYINFMNSDDCFICNDAVSKSVLALEKGNYDISYSDWYETKGQQENFRKGNLATIFFQMPFCHQTVFCKKSLLEKLKYFDLSYKIAADRDFLFRSFFQGARFVKVHKPLALFSLEGASKVYEQITAEEDIQVLYRNIQKVAPITEASCREFARLGILPYGIVGKLARKQPLKVRIACYWNIFKNHCFWMKEKLKSIRYWLFKVRTRKGRRVFRVLGINFINEEKK